MINKLINRLPYIQPDNLREFFEERAGIREFDGGLPREHAEEEAFFDTIAFFALENHIKETTTNTID